MAGVIETEPLVVDGPGSSPWRRPPGGRALILLPVLLLLLGACGPVPSGAAAVRSRSGTTSRAPKGQSPATPGTRPRVSPAGSPAAVAAASPNVKVELAVRIELEPNDYLHRNYCGEGAIAVLLSTWTRAVPSIDAIGAAAQVVESYGGSVGICDGLASSIAGRAFGACVRLRLPVLYR